MTVQLRTIMRLNQLKKGDRVFSVPHEENPRAPHGWGTVAENPKQAEAEVLNVYYDKSGVEWGTFVARITQWQPGEKK